MCRRQMKSVCPVAKPITRRANAPRPERLLGQLFCLLLLARLLYPYFNSPMDHLFSDPRRHWDNGASFLHPTIMGATDPFLYQAWLYALRLITRDSTPAVLLGCGTLCAAMPYGWYRALRELQPRSFALVGALLIGVIPESISVYGYFMNETLLLTLLGFCFWLTLRARRKGTLAAFAAACAVWSCAAFTRTVAVPLALGCLLWILVTQRQRVLKAFLAIAIGLVLAVPAGLHAEAKLHFFAPLGNLVFNEIYGSSGTREIAVNYGPDGVYHFGSPTFYNPTFYPFSDWTTDRVGIATIRIDLTRGWADWRHEMDRISTQRTFPRSIDREENLAYLLFAQIWPNSHRQTALGWLTLWSRWLWPPLIVLVAWAAWRRHYQGDAWLLPLSALSMLALLGFQTQGVMEARFREPLDPIVFAAALLIQRRSRLETPAS
jgi:hypothetical protein